MIPASFARRGFLKLLGALGIVAGCRPYSDDDSESAEQDLNEGEYDYIVIGSGAGGGPLAANLARSGFKVLLMEAGEDRGASLNYQVPAWHTKSTEDPTMRWDYYVDHYKDDARARKDSKFSWLTPDEKVHVGPNAPSGSKPLGIMYPRSGTLGGCTAHNAMITVYPHERDFEHLRTVTGDKNFAPKMMRKYFTHLENAEYMGLRAADKGHGDRGWLKVNRPEATLGLTDNKLVKILISAASRFANGDEGGLISRLANDVGQLKALMNADVNAPGPERDQAEGVYGIPLATTHDGKRNGPREYILETARKLPSQLIVKTGVVATRLALEKQDDGTLKATGVHYRSGKHLYRADPAAAISREEGREAAEPFRARREIIIACGAFNTPQLLKLSGIGPREELEELGIEVHADLPGVGANLQDRYEVGVVSEMDKDFSLLEKCTWGAPAANGGADPCFTDWQAGKGVYTSNGAVGAVIKKSGPSQADPDLIIFGLPGYFRGYHDGYSTKVTADKRHFTWAVLKAHTGNTAGTVKLRSKDPLDTPAINFRYFDEGTASAAEADLEAVAVGLEFARGIGAKTRDLFNSERDGELFRVASYEEVVPGPSVRSRDDIKRFIKDEAWGHHASCTCKIGSDSDPMAVLDNRFKVRGTSNLRVVDASVFPKIPGFFIVLPIYMMSEKATDDILEDAGKPRRVV